jgi:hypothetical protein
MANAATLTRAYSARCFFSNAFLRLKKGEKEGVYFVLAF